MGTVITPQPVKLIAGIIASSLTAFDRAERLLVKAFGPVDYKSQTIRFDITSYYEEEMGADLKRHFISFQRLIDPAALSAIKLTTNRMERRLSNSIKAVNRPVNIDPGYLTDAKLVLASTKDHCHRIYLNKGIYAEVTLIYQDGSFRPCQRTYSEYKSDEYIKIFHDIRNIFMQQRRKTIC